MTTPRQSNLFDDVYPDYPGFRDTDTSKDAATDVAPKARVLRDKVLALLKVKPMSADQCAAALHESPLTIRPRVAELNKMDLVRDTGRRALNASGKKAIVWEATANPLF